jgi:hypothetical protein
MKNINSSSETLFSIAEVNDSFNGRYKVRGLINKIMPSTSFIYAEARRPSFQPSVSYALIKRVSGQIKHLNLSEDLFSVSFDYLTRENNEDIVQLLAELWFDYEQPFFSFFQSILEDEKKEKIKPTMMWDEVAEIAPCFVLFRSAEENVIWVGKSKAVTVDLKGILEER